MANVVVRLDKSATDRLLKGTRGPVQLHMANFGRKAEGEVRRCLPKVSRRLEKSVKSRLIKAARNEWASEVYSDEAYASWIEDGKRFDPRSGRTIYVKVGPRPCFEEGISVAARRV